MSYSVGQVAALAGVTVRTLHHYDEIGLLTPGDRSRAGYRRYGEDDLQRLQEIMFYRELGFSLDEITDLVHDPHADTDAHLRRQHELLVGRLARVRRMVEAVEKAMEAHTMGISLTPEERFEVFGDFDPAVHADEAQERWGESDAFKQSARRTAAEHQGRLAHDQGRGRRRHSCVRRRDDQRRDAGLVGRDGSWRNGIVSTSGAGSTTARPTCIAAWATCTSRILASRRRTTRWPRGSRCLCGTRSWPMLRAGVRRLEA